MLHYLVEYNCYLLKIEHMMQNFPPSLEPLDTAIFISNFLQHNTVAVNALTDMQFLASSYNASTSSGKCSIPKPTLTPGICSFIFGYLKVGLLQDGQIKCMPLMFSLMY